MRKLLKRLNKKAIIGLSLISAMMVGTVASAEGTLSSTINSHGIFYVYDENNASNSILIDPTDIQENRTAILKLQGQVGGFDISVDDDGNYTINGQKIGAVGTAGTTQVLEGYTFSSATAGLEAEGTMANRGAVTANALSQSTFPTGYYSSSALSLLTASGLSVSDGSYSSLPAGATVTIPKDHFTGSDITITAQSLADQTSIDSDKIGATSNEILSGYQAWVNGSKVTGNIKTASLSETKNNTSGYTVSIPKESYTGSADQSKNIPYAALSTSTGSSSNKNYTVSIAANSFTGTSKQSKTVPWLQTSKLTVSSGTYNSLTAGGTVKIPTGYYTGEEITITAKTLASQTGVDSGKTAATSAQILSGYQAWVNGGKVTGSIGTASISGATNSSDGYTASIAASKYTGSGSSVTIAKASVTGSAQSDGSYKYSIAGGKYTGANGSSGTISALSLTASSGSTTSALKAGGTVTVGAGYNKSSQTITAASLSSQTSATASSTDIISGKTAWVNGSKVTGGMTVPTTAAVSAYSGGDNTYSVASGSNATITNSSTTSSASGQTTIKLGVGQQVTIPRGYYNGPIVVTNNVANKGSLNWKPTSNTTYTVPAGYYSGGTLDSSLAYNAGYNAGTAAEHSYNSSKAFSLRSGINGAWAIYPLPYPTTNIIQITAEYTEGTCVSGDFLRLMDVNGGDLSENYGLTLFLSQNQVQGDNVAYIAVNLTSRSEDATVILRVYITT